MLYILLPRPLVLYPAQSGHRVRPTHAVVTLFLDFPDTSNLFTSETIIKVPNNSIRGMVCFFNGATLDFEATRRTSTRPSLKKKDTCKPHLHTRGWRHINSKKNRVVDDFA